MEERAIYAPRQQNIIETEFRALALKAAADIGYTLTPEQALALGYELAKTGNGSIDHVALYFCQALVYDLETEHPVHTWGRWAADVADDQTPPGQGYTAYVADRRHTGRVTVDAQQYTADAPTLAGLAAYFSNYTDRLKSPGEQENFNSFVRHRIAEGRMQPVVAGASV